MIKKLILFVLSVLVIPSCSGSILIDGGDLSLFVWTGLTWKWVDSGVEEVATKRLVYEEQFGEGNTLRLNQSMSVWNNLAFCFNHGDECRVYDLNSLERFYCEPLPDKSHHNNAQFSNMFYEPDDKFPLLVLSRGDYPPNQNDVYVVRIIEDEKSFAFSVVKTIHNTIQEAQYNGSWVIDEEHGKLFLYCMTSGDWRVKEDNRFCVFSFELPDICNPEEITLTYDDALEKWEYTYLVLQGGTYFNGYLFFNVQSLESVEGKSVVSHKSVIAVNSLNGHIDAVLPLDDIKETEGISVYNQKLYVSFKSGSVNQASTAVVFSIIEYSLPESMKTK